MFNLLKTGIGQQLTQGFILYNLSGDIRTRPGCLLQKPLQVFLHPVGKPGTVKAPCQPSPSGIHDFQVKIPDRNSIEP
jgi:hypothetical protein